MNYKATIQATIQFDIQFSASKEAPYAEDLNDWLKLRALNAIDKALKPNSIHDLSVVLLLEDTDHEV